MSSIEREIRDFHAVVVQWRQKNVQKCVLHVQSCCFADQHIAFFDVFAAVVFVVAKAPYSSRGCQKANVSHPAMRRYPPRGANFPNDLSRVIPTM